jgi:hypothetical protein
MMIVYVSVRSPMLLIASEEPTTHDSGRSPLLTQCMSTSTCLVAFARVLVRPEMLVNAQPNRMKMYFTPGPRNDGNPA